MLISMLSMYWVGQKLGSGFSITSYQKTQTNFLLILSSRSHCSRKYSYHIPISHTQKLKLQEIMQFNNGNKPGVEDIHMTSGPLLTLPFLNPFLKMLLENQWYFQQRIIKLEASNHILIREPIFTLSGSVATALPLTAFQSDPL